MDWCVKGVEEANHPPVARVTGSRVRQAKAGETIKLAATATDPDDHKLAAKWWQYTDADSAKAVVPIERSESLEHASFIVPNEPSKQVQIILEVTDDGTPPLVGYQRLIFSIH
jgi:hypothetical protein